MRIALVGIGNELNGDDAAGVLMVRILAQKFQNQEKHIGQGKTAEDRCASVRYETMRTAYLSRGEYDLMLVEGGIAPEAFSGPLRRFGPDWVILIDAAAMDEEPGATAWVDWRLADGLSATTHTMPPTMLAKFLIHELGCQVGLVGVQPACVEMDAALDGNVAKAVAETADGIFDMLG